MSVEPRGRWNPVLVGGVAVLAGLVAGCSAATGGGEPAGDRSPRQLSHWVEGATVESVAGTLRVGVPGAATEVKAAHWEGLQDDSLILAFVLPSGEVDAFVAQLEPEEPLRLREQPFARNMDPTAPFSHLGVPEPDLLGKVREGQVCAPCEGDLNWLKVAVAQIDDRTSRVYVRGVD
ncbi:hypothetical protein ACFWUZ_23440 [Streptomyces sp. NPDC058646]|uniref:hypothetical protein n=1 Tax=Streptomyces sp. NPDC058646 TaxID=3346574 RepID=UPI003648BB8B